MEILIAYYSRTGGTEKVAEDIKKEFENRGHFVDIEKVKPVRERGWWSWFFLRFFKGGCDIYEPEIKDVSRYDVICIGSPNWTRLSLPMAKYLQEIKGLKYKNIGFFATSALWPRFEWYIFSAYLLDLTFSRIIEKKRGRVIESILLSSIIKKWSQESEHGKKVVKNFCTQLEISAPSFKDYSLKQKEIDGTRGLIVLFSVLLFLSLIYQFISSLLGFKIFAWNQYFYLFAIGVLILFLMLVIMERKKGIFLGKYLAGICLALEGTLLILFLAPSLGRPIILGYVLIFIFISFFREVKAVLLTGLVSVLGYFFLLFNYPLKGVLSPGLDLVLLLLSIGIISIITKNLQSHYVNLLLVQDEIERERAALEVRVIARTRQLQELARSLKAEVKERTKELEEKNLELEGKNKEIAKKMEEVEKFNKLAVGRELKMIELKKEIEGLKEALRQAQGKN